MRHLPSIYRPVWERTVRPLGHKGMRPMLAFITDQFQPSVRYPTYPVRRAHPRPRDARASRYSWKPPHFGQLARSQARPGPRPARADWKLCADAAHAGEPLLGRTPMPANALPNHRNRSDAFCKAAVIATEVSGLDKSSSGFTWTIRARVAGSVSPVTKTDGMPNSL